MESMFRADVHLSAILRHGQVGGGDVMEVDEPVGTGGRMGDKLGGVDLIHIRSALLRLFEESRRVDFLVGLQSFSLLPRISLLTSLVDYHHTL